MTEQELADLMSEPPEGSEVSIETQAWHAVLGYR